MRISDQNLADHYTSGYRFIGPPLHICLDLGGTLNIMVIIKKMELATLVKNLEKAVFTSIHSTLCCEQIKLFSLGSVTSLEGKH